MSGGKTITGAVFLDVAKAFKTVWIDGFLHKLTLLTVHTISSYLRGQTFETFFETVTLSRRGMRSGVAQSRVISAFLFILYVNIPSPSHHVELALYAEDMSIVITSRI
jgi:hypothetical protein